MLASQPLGYTLDSAGVKDKKDRLHSTDQEMQGIGKCMFNFKVEHSVMVNVKIFVKRVTQNMVCYSSC